MAECSIIITLKRWPPDPPMVFVLEREPGEARFSIGADSRVNVRIFGRDESGLSLMHDLTSGRLVFPPEPLALLFSANWWGRSYADIWVQATQVACIEDPALSARDYVFVSSPNPNKATDFTARNERARVQRAGKLTHWLRPKHGSMPGGTKHLLEALREEVEQIELLLASLVKTKTLSSVRTLAGKLRILLCRDGQTPLLLACAAIKDASLLVYGNGNPEESPWLNDESSGFGVASIQTSPDIFLNTPVDIELWLEFEVMRLNRRKISNHELIKDLGNSIGNHLDPNIRLSVSTLRGWRFGDDSEDSVKHYVQRVSEVVVFLAKDLLNR